MTVWVAVINCEGKLAYALVETASSEGGIIRIIRRWAPQATQQGCEFYDAKGILVAFYVMRHTARLEEQEA